MKTYFLFHRTECLGCLTLMIASPLAGILLRVFYQTETGVAFCFGLAAGALAQLVIGVWAMRRGDG